MYKRRQGLFFRPRTYGRTAIDQSHCIIRRRKADKPDTLISSRACGLTDVDLTEILYQSGASSGWHSHPGRVILSIREGEPAGCRV